MNHTFVLTAAGAIHICHTLLYIVYPWWKRDTIGDLFYLNYTFYGLFSYTFFDGECPFSFFCRVLKDDDYVAGTEVEQLVDLETVLGSQEFVDLYLATTNPMCIVSFVTVAIRIPKINNVYFCYFYLVIVVYSAFVDKFYNKHIYSVMHSRGYFPFIQECCKYAFAAGMIYLSVLIDRESPETMVSQPIHHFTKTVIVNALFCSLIANTLSHIIELDTRRSS